MKGQALSNLSASAIAIIILIMVVAIGATVLQNVRTTNLDHRTVLNVSDNGNPYTASNLTGRYNFSIPNEYAKNVVISNHRIYNASSWTQTLNTGNYTLIDTISFNFTNVNIWGGLTVNWSYDVYFEDYPMDYNISSVGLSSMDTWSDFFAVIVVVVVFGIVIGLFAMFTTRRGEGSSY